MRYHTRRREIGKMFVDIVKYIVTVAIIGSLLTDKLSVKTALIGIGASIGFLLVGFFIIPTDCEEK